MSRLIDPSACDVSADAPLPSVYPVSSNPPALLPCLFGEIRFSGGANSVRAPRNTRQPLMAGSLTEIKASKKKHSRATLATGQLR
jgi:hypothetical protein